MSGGSLWISKRQKKIAVELLHCDRIRRCREGGCAYERRFSFFSSWRRQLPGQWMARWSRRVWIKRRHLHYGVTAVKNVTKDGMHFKVHVAIAEGPYVALFGESNATSNKARAAEQQLFAGASGLRTGKCRSSSSSATPTTPTKCCSSSGTGYERADCSHHGHLGVGKDHDLCHLRPPGRMNCT